MRWLAPEQGGLLSSQRNHGRPSEQRVYQRILRHAEHAPNRSLPPSRAPCRGRSSSWRGHEARLDELRQGRRPRPQQETNYAAEHHCSFWSTV
jgi:hypothetical protein